MSFTVLSDVLDKLTEKYGGEVPEVENHAQWLVDRYNESTGTLNEIDGYNCDICRNKGYIARLDDNGYEVHAECRCQTIRSTLRRARRSGLGDIISDFTFSKYDDTEDWQKTLKQTAQAFCADDAAKWFVICGQVGCGKTHLCAAIAAHYIKTGREVKYMLWVEESKRLKAFANDKSYTGMIAEYKSVDVLYIDDLFKTKQGESPTAADINLAFEIINHRLLHGDKITIISSEKLLDELIDYDEGTMSRIFQKCGKYKLSIARDRAKNYRLRG